MPKRRIAVVSPTIDKRHGTERRVAECVSRLSGEYEIHVYSKRVDDVDLSKLTWHRIPEIPGPHLARYLWWFVANHLSRWWHRRISRCRYDLVYSPGINCLDADVVTVHILFSEYRRRDEEQSRLRQNPAKSWPRLLHRRLYYALVALLERRIYLRPNVALATVSAQVSENLQRWYGRSNHIPVVHQGIDFDVFNPTTRLERRSDERKRFGLADGFFVLLLIGNDWRNKGLPCLLEAMAQLPDLPLKLLVVGQDDRTIFAAQAERLSLGNRVQFRKPSADVMQFYAAADAYAGPSLHDSFALPPSEAMACGLPVIASRTNGAAEMITDGADGLVLQDPQDSTQLARLIRCLVQDPALRQRLGENAFQTAQGYTWERNAEQMRRLFEEALARKASR
jgi:UDP-glucose:(heptosyl)LPS alpha-1,3-glucosyltransferase